MKTLRYEWLSGVEKTSANEKALLMCPSSAPSCCPRQTIKAIRAQTGVVLAVAWKAMHDEVILLQNPGEYQTTAYLEWGSHSLLSTSLLVTIPTRYCFSDPLWSYEHAKYDGAQPE